MLEFLRENVEKFLLDPSVVVSAVYRIDGSPIITKIRGREHIRILQWLEEQMRAIIEFLLDGTLKSVEFKTKDYTVLLFPLTRTLALVLVSNSEASIYKLKIDAESVRKTFNV